MEPDEETSSASPVESLKSQLETHNQYLKEIEILLLGSNFSSPQKKLERSRNPSKDLVLCSSHISPVNRTTSFCYETYIQQQSAQKEKINTSEKKFPQSKLCLVYDDSDDEDVKNTSKNEKKNKKSRDEMDQEEDSKEEDSQDQLSGSSNSGSGSISSSETQEKKKRRKDRVVICFTQLSTDQMKLLTTVVNCLGNATVLQNYGSSVTHVVCGKLEDGKVARTMKYFFGILQGKWIVSFDWIEASKEKQHWVHEEKFEICIDTTGPTQGPMLGRKNRENGGVPLFQDYSLYFHGTFPWKDEELETLLNLAGVTRITQISKKYRRCQPEKYIAICQPGDVNQTIAFKRKHPGLTILSSLWFLDSISNYKVLSMDEYTL